MTDEIIARLLETRGLGRVTRPVLPVPGGFTHRVFRADTRDGAYAVKHLNPEIMKRPGAVENFRRAERLERTLEGAGLPIVPAMALGGQKMQELDGHFFYVFHWQKGRITDWRNITGRQCLRAGEILGRIHALEPAPAVRAGRDRSDIDWSGRIEEADRRNSPVLSALRENEALLYAAQDALNRARQALPEIVCITDEDMDPKNVMWDEGKPAVIDLECLDFGNPVSGALQLSLQWSGITTCALEPERMKAFFKGYLGAYDCGFRAYAAVFGLAYTWTEWLEFNLRRALGHCADERERETGIEETLNTIGRIRYIHAEEDRIKRLLDGMFRK